MGERLKNILSEIFWEATAKVLLKTVLIVVVSVFLYLAFWNTLYAATVTQEHRAKEIDQRLKQEILEEIRNQEIQATEKIRKSRKFEEDKESEQKELTSQDKDKCIPLDNIYFNGNTVYSSSKLKRKFLKKYIIKEEEKENKKSNNNKTEDNIKTNNSTDKKNQFSCITKSNLNTIQTEITNYYISKGYTNTRVYFDTNRLNSERVLIIFIAEGHIKDIELNNNSKLDSKLPFRKSTKKFTAFPLMKNKPFNLRDFEQGIDQMNRLASNNAKMESRPGEVGGYSDIVITNTISNPTRIDISYDNSGQKSTGQNKRKISLSQDNLLALNDNLYINYTKDDENHSSDRNSKSIYTSLSVPLGYWTLTGSYSKSKYLTTVRELSTTVRTKGRTSTENYKIDRVITRGKRHKTKLGTELTKKDTRTYIGNERIDTGTRKLTIGTVFLDNTLYTNAGTFYLKPSYTEGLSVLRAKKDSDTMLRTNPHAQYELMKLYGYYTRNFKTKLPFNYMLTFDSQYSWDTLYGSEQFSIGGEYTVRGFHENSISGDHGYNIRNDIKINVYSLKESIPLINKIKTKNINFINTLLSRTDLKLFYDYGFIRNKYINGDETARGYMSGTGAGINYTGKYINLGLVYSRGLHSPKYIENVYNNTPDEESVYFTVSVGLGA
ncbi:ShlB/FhaC/HecB family hemolysin secretion/activation protein [Pseudomonadota bacterium]